VQGKDGDSIVGDEAREKCLALYALEDLEGATADRNAAMKTLRMCCAVLCCAVLCCAVLCCAVLCCAVLCCAVLCCAVLC
jgi:hypothetical protein